MVRKTITFLATLAAFAVAAVPAEARHLATGNLKANIFADGGGENLPIQCSTIWLQGDYAYEITVWHKTGVCSEIQAGDAEFLYWNSKKAVPHTGQQTGWIVLREGNEENCHEPAHAGNIPLGTLVNLLGCK
jgi:hypothetical protein